MPGRALVAPKDIERLCSVKGGNEIFRSKIALWRGDITRLEFDAIVNAANETLRGGGGVDGAIHAAAGRQLLKECIKLNGCETGEAKITKGYKLPAKHVIHTVGPIGESADLLASCYHNSLNLMLTNGLKTIAFPCISTGIYGYPNESAAKVALETTKSWLEQHSKKVDMILFCLFLPVDVKIYNRLVEEYFPPKPGHEIHHGGGNASSSVDDPLGKKEDSGNTKDTPSSLSSTLTNEIAPMKIEGSECATTANKLSDGNSPNRGDSDNLKETREHKEEKEANKDDHKIEESNWSGINEGVQARPTRDIASMEGEAVDSATNESKHSDCNFPKESESDSPKETIKPPKKEGSKENEDLSVLSEEVRAEWIERFRSSEVEAHDKVICTDTESWVAADRTFPLLKLVGGLDISYHVTKPDIASVSMVVLSFPELEVVHEDTTIESVDVPYISGYLAYREAKHFQKKIKKAADAGFAPQITLVDGNGILHPRKFGSAVHVGVSSDVPTIGVAKNLLIMEEFGIKRDDVHTSKIEALNGKGSSFDMMTNDNQILGKALLTSGDSKKPVYVSVGHRCSLDTATNVTLACSKVRVPEPIRQADHRSKLLLQKEFEEDYIEYHANK